MAVQVSRSDTGQFVLIDPATDTVVIDDDLAAGFAKLEQVLAESPPASAPATTRGSSAFSFAGGPRYTPMLLAVLLPFAWLAVLYFALAHLLSEHALDRSEAKQMRTQVQELEREIQALRSEISGAPRTAKAKPTRQAEVKTKPTPPAAVPPPTVIGKPATSDRDKAKAEDQAKGDDTGDDTR